MPQNVSTAVVQRRVESRQSLDDFPTPPWATRALIEEVLAPMVGTLRDPLVRFRACNVWEPACGRGHMAAALKDYFYAVHASDLADYRAEEVQTGGYIGQARVADFLGLDAVPPHIERGGVDWIITNPPFVLAPQFIRRALALRPRGGVAMLVRLALLEGKARWAGLFQPHPPTIVAPFVERVPMVKGRLTATGTTATAYCWLVWDLRPAGGLPEPVVRWIPPCRKRLEREGDYPEARR